MGDFAWKGQSMIGLLAKKKKKKKQAPLQNCIISN